MPEETTTTQEVAKEVDAAATAVADTAADAAKAVDKAADNAEKDVKAEVVKAEKLVKKVIVNPTENAQGFVEQLQSGAAKRIGYQVLDYMNGVAGNESSSTPGNADKKSVSAKDFMGYLKDGDILAKFANALQPGAVKEPEPAAPAPAAEKKEGEEENKEAEAAPTTVNAALEKIKGFLDFAKTSGVSSAENVKAEDVEQGKPQAFQGMLATLIGLGGQGASKFSAQNLDADALMSTVQNYVPKSFMQQLMALKDRLFKRQPAVAAKKTEVNEVKAEIAAVDETPAVEAQ